MKYVVVNKFKDKENENVVYEIGENYPKGDYKPTKKRISQLSKEHPKYKCVFIEEVNEE
jgi:hypothetical protein